MSYQYQYLSTGHRPFVIISFTIWIISIISWSKKKVEYVYLPLGPTYILLVPSEELVPVGFGYWNCLDDDIHRKSFQAFLNKVGKPTFIVYFPFLAQTRLEERSTDWLRFAPVSGCNKKSLVLWNSGNLWHSLLRLSYRSLLLWCATFRESDESQNLVEKKYRKNQMLFGRHSVGKKLILKMWTVMCGGSCILLRRLVTNDLADLPFAGRQGEAVNSNVALRRHRILQWRICLWRNSNVNTLKEYWKLTEPVSFCDDSDVVFHNESLFLSFCLRILACIFTAPNTKNIKSPQSLRLITRINI